jgi:hypothetical protein
MTAESDYEKQLASAFMRFETHVCDICLMAKLALDAAGEHNVNMAIFTARQTLALAEKAKEERYRLHKEASQPKVAAELPARRLCLVSDTSGDGAA